MSKTTTTTQNLFTNAKIADIEEQIFDLSVQLNTYSSVYPETLIEKLEDRMSYLKKQLFQLKQA